MCRGSMCFKGFTKLKRYWYQDKREQVYLDIIEELFEQYNEEYKDVIMTFFNVIQNRYEYIKLNYTNVACEVLEPLLRVTWIDVDYLMNNSNEIFYEPFTFEKYLMISKYEKGCDTINTLSHLFNCDFIQCMAGYSFNDEERMCGEEA
jgi:hypothetical protein